MRSSSILTIAAIIPIFPLLRFLRSNGCIEIVIIRSETRDGMRKAYELTGKGKKMVPLFARLKETEKDILEMVR